MKDGRRQTSLRGAGGRRRAAHERACATRDAASLSPARARAGTLVMTCCRRISPLDHNEVPVECASSARDRPGLVMNRGRGRRNDETTRRDVQNGTLVYDSIASSKLAAWTRGARCAGRRGRRRERESRRGDPRRNDDTQRGNSGRGRTGGGGGGGGGGSGELKAPPPHHVRVRPCGRLRDGGRHVRRHRVTVASREKRHRGRTCPDRCRPPPTPRGGISLASNGAVLAKGVFLWARSSGARLANEAGSKSRERGSRDKGSGRRRRSTTSAVVACSHHRPRSRHGGRRDRATAHSWSPTTLADDSDCHDGTAKTEPRRRDCEEETAKEETAKEQTAKQETAKQETAKTVLRKKRQRRRCCEDGAAGGLRRRDEPRRTHRAGVAPGVRSRRTVLPSNAPFILSLRMHRNDPFECTGTIPRRRCTL